MERTASRVISHRGNLVGPVPSEENSPLAIARALAAGFDVEVDVLWHNDQFWLGHDRPQYLTTSVELCNPRLWCHAKDVITLAQLLDHGAHCFAHHEDNCALTSQGYIWYFAGMQVPATRAILVLPEKAMTRISGRAMHLKTFAGVCTDYPRRYER
jgi:glycerophosphoryl diester phosphodiesterase